MVVANAGPLIVFVRAGYWDLLRKTVGTVTIPQAVFEEIVVKGEGKLGAREVKVAEWITTRHIQHRERAAQHSPQLERGEREAIVLAQERQENLLIDDATARKTAEARGVQCVGTLWILQKAKEEGSIARVTPVLDAFRSAGLRLGNALYSKFLAMVGEREEEHQ